MPVGREMPWWQPAPACGAHLRFGAAWSRQKKPTARLGGDASSNLGFWLFDRQGDSSG